MYDSDMSDYEWSLIAPLLPHKSRGVSRVDDRRVINGILYRLRTGTSWRSMPACYGPRTTVYNRFIRWKKAGIWDNIFDTIRDNHNHDLLMIDSTVSNVHHAGSSVKKNSNERCMGRSKGGLTTKIHMSCNEYGLPLQFHLSAGNRHDAPYACLFLENLQPFQSVLADRAYDADAIIRMIEDKGSQACIPPKSNRICPRAYDKTLYKQRNIIERLFGKLKQSCRAIATRYDKHASTFMAMIKIATIRLWCKFYESTA